MIRFISLILIVFFSSFIIHANESILTLQQQLDRLQREVNDLNQFSFSSNDNSNKVNLEVFDIRIYDLEKDIKKLHLNIEEILFQLNDTNELLKVFDIRLNFLEQRLDQIELQ